MMRPPQAAVSAPAALSGNSSQRQDEPARPSRDHDAESFAALQWTESLVSLLRTHPGGELRLQDFAPAYKAKFGTKFNPRSYGAETLDGLCQGLQEVELVGSGAATRVRLVKGVSQSVRDPAELKKRLFEVLKRRPGMALPQLERAWHQEFNESLDLYYSYGIAGIGDFRTKMSSVCKCKHGLYFPVFNTHMVQQLLDMRRDNLSRSQRHFDAGSIIQSVCHELGVADFGTLGLGRCGFVAIYVHIRIS